MTTSQLFIFLATKLVAGTGLTEAPTVTKHVQMFRESGCVGRI